MKRRTALVLGAAGAGLAAGGGTAWWRAREALAPDGSSPAAYLWSLSFEALDGTALSMTTLRGRPLLLNFWATWCAPCVTEMPLLDAFARDPGNAPWQVLALALDRREPVRNFVAEHRLNLGVALAGASGLDLARQLGNRVGALPFSVAFDSQGLPSERKTGTVTAELLAGWKQTIR